MQRSPPAADGAPHAPARKRKKQKREAVEHEPGKLRAKDVYRAAKRKRAPADATAAADTGSAGLFTSLLEDLHGA